jgi:hypothetical protein
MVLLNREVQESVVKHERAYIQRWVYALFVGGIYEKMESKSIL